MDDDKAVWIALGEWKVRGWPAALALGFVGWCALVGFLVTVRYALGV